MTDSNKDKDSVSKREQHTIDREKEQLTNEQTDDSTNESDKEHSATNEETMTSRLEDIQLAGNKNKDDTSTEKNNGDVSPKRKSNEDDSPTGMYNKDVSPTYKHNEDVSSTNKNNEDVSPTNKNNMDVSPTNKNNEDDSPTNKNNMDVSPTNKNSEGVSPTNKNNQNVSSTIKNDNISPENRDVANENYSRDWDDAAEIPTVHFSFIINSLFSKQSCSWKTSRSHLEIEKINQRRLAQLGANVGVNSVPVGSVAECYQMPAIISKIGISNVQNLSDTDVLMVWDTSPIKELDKFSTTKQKLIIETEGIHPGYTRIFINDPETVLRNVDPEFSISIEGRHYLSAIKQRKDAERNMKLESMMSKIPMMVDQTGPATAIEDTSSRTLKFFQTNKKVQDRQELVPAIKCTWPSQATEWIKRVKGNDWISQSLAASIVHNGCHVVPVAHKLTKFPDVEWRISFATSEVQLAKEAVTKDQRQCYLYFKLLGNIVLKQLKLISSYHLKTTFLHACEKLPVSLWRENAGCCVLYMLDSLLEYIRNKWLPSYFVPENNLIDHFTESEFLTIETILQAARLSPIAPILDFTDSHVIGNQSVTASFRQNVSDILNDFESFRSHRNIQNSLSTFILALNRIVSSLLLDNKTSDAVVYLLDSYEFLKRYITDSTIDKFICSSLVLWKLSIQLVQIYEIVLTYVNQYPDLVNLKSYLACLYHSVSFNFVPRSSNYIEALQKSDSLFKSALQSSNSTTTKIDYALLLFTQGNKSGAIDLLDKLIADENKLSEFVNSYNIVTFLTLSERLRNEIRTFLSGNCRVVAFRSISLAYYLRLEFSEIADDVDIRTTVDKFHNYCQNGEDGMSFWLFGLALMDLEWWDMAITVLEEVQNLNLDSPLLNMRTKLLISKVCKHLADDNAIEAVSCIKQFCDRHLPNISPFAFSNNIALQLPNPLYSVRLLENITETCDENLINRGNMACMYYSYALTQPPDSEQYLTSMVQADTLFYTSVVAESSGCQMASTVDYISFLCGQDRWSDASDLLNRFLNHDEKDSQAGNSYGELEYNGLDEHLKKEVSLQGSVHADSESFAYYFLIKCLLQINKKDVTKRMSEFKQHCFKRNCPISYSLLGYCNIMFENWGEAELCFCRAVEKKWDYTAAKQNIALCRQHLSWKRDLRQEFVPLCIIPELLGDFTLDFDKISAM